MIDSNFPSQGKEKHLSAGTRTAGDVLVPSQFFGNKQGAIGQAKNEDAAKKGGEGYSPKNIDFGLLDKVNK
jgi:hypothetical protein